ncbi:unnamed protein product, partial [Polarella glacialis]
AARVLSRAVLQRLQHDFMVQHLQADAPGLALEAGLQGLRGVLAAEAPGSWRRREKGYWSHVSFLKLAAQRGEGLAPDEEPRNRHGFGGGQTPIEEFMATKETFEPKAKGEQAGSPTNS